MNNNIAASSLVKIRELQGLIDILNNTTIGTITLDISDIQARLTSIESDIINLQNNKTSLKQVKQYIRLKESLI